MRINPSLKILFALLPAFLNFFPAHALTFCINDVATLEAARNLSTSFSAEPISIKVVQGTYLPSINLSHHFAPPMSIQGAFPCTK